MIYANKFFNKNNAGSAFAIISIIGEYGSRDNIGISFIWSHFPKWNDRQGMFKLLSLVGVSVRIELFEKHY